MFIYVVFLGALVNSASIALYIWDMFKKNVRPNRVMFFIWALIPLIATVAALFEGARWVVLPFFVSGLGAVAILFASYRIPESYWRLTRFDWICGALALSGLFLWQVTKDGNIALFFAVIADFIGTLPTLKKSWTNPETESARSYFLGIFGSAAALFGVEEGSFAELAYPVYAVVICFVIFALVRLRGRKILPPLSEHI